MQTFQMIYFLHTQKYDSRNDAWNLHVSWTQKQNKMGEKEKNNKTKQNKINKQKTLIAKIKVILPHERLSNLRLREESSRSNTVPQRTNVSKICDSVSPGLFQLPSN